MEDKTPLEAVQRLLPEVAEVRDKIKTMRDQLKDMLSQNEEYQKIEETSKELSTKRAEAKKMLLDDKQYRVLKDDLDDERLKLKDLEEILSHYLVSYYDETKKTEIQDSSGETRQVVISAKIGKTTE